MLKSKHTSHYIVSIYDRACGRYHPPFAVRHLTEATRAFSHAIDNPLGDNDLNKHPFDFELWHIADWDDCTGIMNHKAEAELLLKGSDALLAARAQRERERKEAENRTD